MTDTAAPTATEIADAVRAGRLTARRAVEDALSRIEAVDNRLHAFQEVRVFAALREADEVDARPDRAELPLAGVPIAIKDNVPVAGEPMRDGTSGSDPSPQRADHEVVRRLRAAGAVVVGLTTVPDLCVFGATDSVFGITRNPWNPSRSPGGSSGGSAAAVAAGAVPLALGNDGLGSIRIPAACCGLVGLKPGAGVVPSDLGRDSWLGMAENGPLATTVEDAALMLSVLADRPGLARRTSPGALRIAVSTRTPVRGFRVDAHWRAAAVETADLLAADGHVVSSAAPPYDQGLALQTFLRWIVGAAGDADLLRDRSELPARTRRHAALGRAARTVKLPRDRGRRRWQTAVEHFFAEYDLLLTPALARSPLEAAAWSRRGWTRNVAANLRYAPFAAPWNVAGWPAMNVPAGLGPDGLPLGVQLVGKPGAESQLLAAARELERLRPWPRVAPPAG
ncbi:amidase [uncultured Jatrophihabitans sp.]|uniref:amidase n=1 Tax=uncultured Jatrophihabitans sp. TaxID=1610747 RepID=UPI0035CB6379